MKKTGIAVCGLNGSGKTTLAKYLASLLSTDENFRALDIEDYYFRKSEPPYTNPRTRVEALMLLQADVERNPRFVLSAVSCDLGFAVTSRLALVILLYAPREIRSERIRRRSLERFGGRVLPGGDMYEREQKFIGFAAGRPDSDAERGLEGLDCKLLRLDGTRPTAELAADIAKIYREL